MPLVVPVEHAEDRHGALTQQRGIVAKCIGCVGDQHLGYVAHHLALMLLQRFAQRVRQPVQALGQHPVFIVHALVGKQKQPRHCMQLLGRRRSIKTKPKEAITKGDQISVKDVKHERILARVIVIDRGLGHATCRGHLIH